MTRQIPIIEKLGGREAIKSLLAEHGVEITDRSLYRWREEGRVSGRHYHILMEEADRRDIAYDYSDFVCEVDCLTSCSAA